METLQQAEDVIKLIDFKLLILIVVMARWSKRYLKDIFPKISFSHKVLFLSTLVSVLYFFIGRHLGYYTNESFYMLLITYFTATSFYEIIYNPIETMIKSKFGNVSNYDEQKKDL